MCFVLACITEFLARCWVIKLSQKATGWWEHLNPITVSKDFSSYKHESLIIGLCITSENHLLLAWSPGNKIVAKEYTIGSSVAFVV